MRNYHASLDERGHRVYDDVTSAAVVWTGRVDVAVCFSVVEHVEDPLTFLRQIQSLLAPGGQLLLSTPNRRDILLESGCEAYRSFFYRTAHTYYFDADSLRHLAMATGFTSCHVRFVHRFGFANYLAWLRDGRPTQNAQSSPLNKSFDGTWRSQLELGGVSDYLFAILGR
jgi:2-polyprenyl-3-methyl-5-hydroxy-6-metoxy-1,4-benzoquinol methylase